MTKYGRCHIYIKFVVLGVKHFLLDFSFSHVLVMLLTPFSVLLINVRVSADQLSQGKPAISII